MNPPNKKSPATKGVPGQRPAAPAVYRPQPVPLVLQRKTAAAPPVYRPRPAPAKSSKQPLANLPAGMNLQRIAQPASPLPLRPKACACAWPNSAIQRAADPARTQHVIGRPPSSRNPAKGGYAAEKLRQQRAMSHVAIGDIPEKELVRIRDSKEAQQVAPIVYIDGKMVGFDVDPEFVDLLKHPAQRHIEHVISEDDGEVVPLSSALACFEKDMQHSEARQNVSHKLALVGPYGACDGCKDRIRLFKNLWREMARHYRSGKATDLVVTYFYHRASRETRAFTNVAIAKLKDGKGMGKKGGKVEKAGDEKTLYGWDENLEVAVELENSGKKGKKSQKEKFFYRSYNASGLPAAAPAVAAAAAAAAAVAVAAPAAPKPNLFQEQIDAWKRMRE